MSSLWILMLVFLILLLISTVSIVVLLILRNRLRELLRWSVFRGIDSKDMDYYDSVLVKEVSIQQPKRIALYRVMSLLVFVLTCSILMMAITFNIILNESRKPTQQKIEYCQEIIVGLYTTHINDLSDYWNKDLKSRVDKSISYRLDPTNIENLAQRHKPLSSTNTEIIFESWVNADNNNIILRYIVKAPSRQEARLAEFKLDTTNRIVDFHEYKDLEFSSEYLLGEP